MGIKLTELPEYCTYHLQVPEPKRRIASIQIKDNDHRKCCYKTEH